MANKKFSSHVITKRLIIVFVFVILGALSAIIISIGSANKVSLKADNLIHVYLPELRTTAMLRDTMSQEVINLYLYYATMEPHASKATLSQIFNENLQTLNKLGLNNQDTESLLKQVESFEKMSNAFHLEMISESRDWDILREHLAAAQIHADSINKIFSLLSERIRSRAADGGQMTLKEISQLNHWQLAFSFGVLAVSVLVLIAMIARQKDQSELYHRAYYDQLTGLPNRRHMQEFWQSSFANKNAKATHSLLLVNLDRFQLITGSLGHSIGDQLINFVSTWVEDKLEKHAGENYLFHLSPATWLIIHPENDKQSLSKALCEDLLKLSATQISLGERKINAGCSIGVTYFPVDGTNIDILLKNADAALRKAILSGGSAYQIFEEAIKLEAEQLLSIESSLREALQQKELELFYQPKIAPKDNHTLGAEALIRWRKNGELIHPCEFIPVAEQTALIIPISEWALNTACQQWRIWKHKQLPTFPVAVNISAQQFHMESFPMQVKSALERANMPAHMLELEITEEAASRNPKQVVETMLALKNIGVTLAIDDFGTGYSSLAYLKQFPLDVLKVDRTFVSQIESSQQDLAIIKMMLALAQQLSLKVVAEGVETSVQKKLLMDLSINLMQGYLFSPPLQALEFEVYLKKQSKHIQQINPH